ncbi:MAG TPA: ROK family protein, partial [Acidimicrobiales bacterium]|nr:ROK family protein [Acidimicrobiales bacterium]
IGVGVPGVVARPDVGEVDADVLGWSGMPLGSALRSATRLPVLIENDVKALAVAERLYGRARALRSFVVVTIGRGVGFACVADGALRRGAHGGAGELAHVVVTSGGPSCACGQRGCLEAYAGAEGLAAAARSAGVLRHGQGVAELAALADGGGGGGAGGGGGGGDHTAQAAREIFSRAAQRLAEALVPALSALDPEAVIVAGEGTASWRHWDGAFRKTLAKRLPVAMRDIAVEVDDWDESSWARGAAAIVLATPFDRHALAGRQRPQVLARLHGADEEKLASAGW